MNFEHRTIDQFVEEEGEVDDVAKEIKVDMVVIVQTNPEKAQIKM